MVEPLGMLTETLICPSSISGSSSLPSSAMLATEITQITTVSRMPIHRRVMNSLSTFLYHRMSGLSAIMRSFTPGSLAEI